MGAARRADDKTLIESALLALRNAAADEGDTAEELAAKIGHSDRWVRKHLKLAQAKGKLIVGKAVRTRLDGQRATVSVYRIAK